MKLLLSLTVFLSLTLGGVSFGQSYVFRVLASKGDNKVQTLEPYQTNPILTGSKLFYGDRIVLGDNAYLGLVHKNGKTLELNQPGSYSIRTLDYDVVSQGGSLAGEYMNLVLNRSVDDQRRPSATFRGSKAASIKLLIKETKNANLVLGNRAVINWVPNRDIITYKVTVKNIFDQVLIERETSQSSFELDFTDSRLSRERFVIVGVRSKYDETKKSRDYGIQRLTEAQGRRLFYQLGDLKRQYGQQSSLNKLVIASFYEANGLYLEALMQYREAAAISPDVSDFKAMYENFILINGLGN